KLTYRSRGRSAPTTIDKITREYAWLFNRRSARKTACTGPYPETPPLTTRRFSRRSRIAGQVSSSDTLSPNTKLPPTARIGSPPDVGVKLGFTRSPWRIVILAPFHPVA